MNLREFLLIVHAMPLDARMNIRLNTSDEFAVEDVKLGHEGDGRPVIHVQGYGKTESL